MALPDSAAAYYLDQQRVATATLLLARRLWARLGTGDFDQAWARLGPQLLAVLLAGQQKAVSQAIDYVPAVLAELNVSADPVAEVAPRSLVGIASDGRPLGSLLYLSVIRARTALGEGLSLPASLSAGGDLLDRIVSTQVVDAGRDAESVAAVVRPEVTGYVRMLNLPSCSRCAILAGRFYKWNAGFKRHPQCVPAGTVVSGPAVESATRRAYEGELVTIRTASHKNLSVTANHPVLTSDGWLPAKLLVEGLDVVSRGTSERAVRSVIPNHHQVPSLVEDVWGAHHMRAAARMPVAPEDFHGDGFKGHVDVVFPDRLLWDRVEPPFLKQLGHLGFAFRSESAVAFNVPSAQSKLFGGSPSLSGADMRGFGLPAEFGTRSSAYSHQPSRTAIANLNAGFLESSSDGWSADAYTARNGVLALAPKVGPAESLVVQRQVSPRWDAPSIPFSMESRGTYAKRGQDLRLRLASQVELDRIVEVTRVQWSGHVYNLTTSEGWFDANGMIVSNCDCRHIPATEHIAGDMTVHAEAAVKAGQVTGLSKADRQAILDGADAAKVVNAQRGMTTGQLFGRDVKLTTEGTTRRGGYSKDVRAADPTVTETSSGKGRKKQHRVPPRLRPESIYQLADDRAHAIELLRKYGYLRS